MTYDQYYYIVNDRPKYMKPIKPKHEPSIQCEFVKSEQVVEDKPKTTRTRKKAAVKEVEEVKPVVDETVEQPVEEAVVDQTESAE